MPAPGEALILCSSTAEHPLQTAPGQVLPVVPLPLIGREQELALTRERLLRPDVRLLTLTGAGGTGKTRLALQLAHDLHAAFSQGACFVDLSPVRDAALVLPMIGHQLGVREAGGRTIPEAIARILGDGSLLLVLDNLEQVLTSAEGISALLQHVPGLKILATSREPLRLRWEHEFPLLPLPIPENGALEVESLALVPSVALFVYRAQAGQPDFALSPSNAPLVAELCRRLDGLPLAIELAAARLKVLPLPALLGRLEKRLDLLKTTARDAPDRHQTLREAIRWSYDLLTPLEQTLFRRLAVFSGGCTLESVEAVCSGDGLLSADILDLLASLVDKSLLVAKPDFDDSVRYRLLETLREYGLEQLRAAGEEAALRARHADWCAALVEQAADEFWSPSMPLWLDRLEREHDNLRGSLDWILEAGSDPEPGLRIAGALWPFWDIRGYLREGHERLDRLLARSPAEASTIGRAEALDASGWLISLQGDFTQALTRASAAEDLWRKLDSPAGLAWSLGLQGMHLYNLQQAERAEAAFLESLALARQYAHPIVSGWSLFGLGHAVWLQGDLQRAEAYLRESLELTRHLAIPWGTAWAEFSLGLLALVTGDLEQAAVLERDCLAIRWSLRDMRTLADSLGMVACLSTARPLLAARLFGATEVLREATGHTMLPWLRSVHEQSTASARAALGEAAFDAAWAEGRTAPLELVIAWALAAEDQPATPSQPGPPATSPEDHQLRLLTAREREVAALIVRGMTSPEIAAELVISERTVDVHADHIRAKLGLRSRAEIAAWAVAHGLHSHA